MLSVIVGHGESILSSRSPSDPQHRQLKEICVAANRSAELTRQLLAFSGHQTIAPRPLDLNERLSVQGLGYRVVPAAGPEEALAICDTHLDPIHLLLTDVSMPRMNGEELFARISESNRAIKVLYMSGYNADILTSQGVLDQGIHFIQKPFAKELLAKKLREELDA